MVFVCLENIYYIQLCFIVGGLQNHKAVLRAHTLWCVQQPWQSGLDTNANLGEGEHAPLAHICILFTQRTMAVASHREICVNVCGWVVSS